MLRLPFALSKYDCNKIQESTGSTSADAMTISAQFLAAAVAADGT